MGNKNNAVSYMQGNSVPAKDDPVRQRVMMLNSGEIKPGQGDPAFALRMQDALAAEREREAQLAAQNQSAVAEYLNGFQVTPETSIAKQIPAGDPMSQYLVGLSRGSERGRMNYANQQIANKFLQGRLQDIQNRPVPAEIGSPGIRGRLFELFRAALGEKQAL